MPLIAHFSEHHSRSMGWLPTLVTFHCVIEGHIIFVRIRNAHRVSSSARCSACALVVRGTQGAPQCIYLRRMTYHNHLTLISDTIILMSIRLACNGGRNVLIFLFVVNVALNVGIHDAQWP